MSNNCACEDFGGCAKTSCNDEQIFEMFTEIMFETFDRDEMAYQHVIQQQAIWDEADGHA